jgi:hypothetical protein
MIYRLAKIRYLSFIMLLYLCSVTIIKADKNNDINLLTLVEELEQKKEWQSLATHQYYENSNRLVELFAAMDHSLDFKILNGIYGKFLKVKDSISLNMYVFHLSSQIEAFGLYSAEKSPSQDFFDIGFESYISRHRLVCWYGNFVVFSESADTLDNLEKHLKEFAEEFVRLLPKSKRKTLILDAFPGKNSVEHSKKYYTGRWLDQEFFKHIYYADYYIPEGYSRIFIIDNLTTSRADSNFWQYFNFIKMNAEIINDTLQIDTDYYVIREPLWGKTILAKKNQIIYGILDYRNRKWAEERLSELLSELKKKKIVKPG